MADLFTEELYSPLFEYAGGVVANVSRIFVDIERFDDIELESMEKFGMGLLYTMTSDERELRKIENRREIVDTYYYPYHQAFEKIVDESLEKFDKCLIIDCHSFNDIARWYQKYKSTRPDICIGFEEFHSNPQTIEKIVDYFKSFDYSVELNIPYSGSIVPMSKYQKDSRVESFMIEINRKLYMDEDNFTKSGNFGLLQERIKSLSKLLLVD